MGFNGYLFSKLWIEIQLVERFYKKKSGIERNYLNVIILLINAVRKVTIVQGKSERLLINLQAGDN